MTKIALYIISTFYGMISIAQLDTLHIHYYPSNQVSSIITLIDKREGTAKAYNQKGEEIYSATIRRYAGHESVQFKHYSSGGVRQAKYSSAPDAGIQWYKSTTSFDEDGNVTSFYEESDEYLKNPIHVAPQPVAQEVVECASIHENKIIIHNHSRYSIEYVLIHQEVKTVHLIQPGEVKEIESYISAEISQEPSQFYRMEVNFQKRKSKKKLKTMMDKSPKGNLQTEYHIHVFESAVKTGI